MNAIRSSGVLLAWSLLLPMRARAAEQPPDCGSAEHRAFDFWVGEWEVRERGAPAAQAPSHSSIQSILGGCVILENWTDADGHFGKSLNAWDPVLRAWKQTWMDDHGGIGEFVGQIGADGLHFEGESHWPARSQPVQRRIAYLPRGDGSLEQRSELSTDGGVTWKPFYDLIYRRAAH